jgi:hypothetical protein
MRRWLCQSASYEADGDAQSDGKHPPSKTSKTERPGASNRCRGMATARKSKPTSTKLRFWRVSIPGHRPEYLGIIEAPDQRSAEAAALREFKLSNEDRKRVVVRARD